MKLELYIQEEEKVLKNLDLIKMREFENLLLEMYNSQKQIFIIGNGGSAATASHFACDLGKGTIKDLDNLERKRFIVQSLTDNLPVITAHGNDLNYDEIFSQQLINLAKEGDLLIVITASGNSKNIIKALEIAKKRKLKTIGLLGFGGGKVANLVDFSIIIDSYDYGVVEDLHLIIEHMICSELKEKLN